MRHLGRLREWIVSGPRYMARVSGFLFFVTAFFITADVITRRLFQFSSQATDEISAFVLAVGSAWAFAHALATGGHVQVDVALSRLPKRAREWLNLVALIVLNLFLGLLVWRAWALVVTSYVFRAQSHSVYHFPLVWPQSLWAAGCTVFLATAIVMLAKALVDVAGGRQGPPATDGKGTPPAETGP